MNDFLQKEGEIDKQHTITSPHPENTRTLCNEIGIGGKKQSASVRDHDTNVKEVQTININVTLYGFNSKNWCRKDQYSEKIPNTLLPISYGVNSQANHTTIPLCNSKLELSTLEVCFYEDSLFDTEKVCIHPKFIHPPPNDVCVTRGDSTSFYESKVVMSKGKKTELIMRQDCYAFNCLQHIILNNSSKKYKDTDSLLSSTPNERPYLWVLLWEKRDGEILFDCIVFTDVSVIRMIKSANTVRAKEALKLIDHSLSEYESKGIMTYKDEKSSTVAHQKVSLFPIRDIKSLNVHAFTFHVKSTDIVIHDVRSDTSLWQEIEKNRLNDTIKGLTMEVERLKRKCGDLQ